MDNAAALRTGGGIMPGKHWIDELYENGSCHICETKFTYSENGITKHKSLSILKGVAYCCSCGDMIYELRKTKELRV
jgi:hypothetical protein